MCGRTVPHFHGSYAPVLLALPWRTLRKLVRYIELENKQMNFDILTNPDQFLRHTKRYTLHCSRSLGA